MQQTTFEIEQDKSAGGSRFVIGVDEVGRGPLAGPVVAAAVAYRDLSFAIPASQENMFALMRDSKKLSEKQREQVFTTIEEYFAVGIGIIPAETIDRVNILEATFLAMKAAISDLKRTLPAGDMQQACFLIDGNQLLPNFSGEQEAIIGGDGISKSIAAASIIAKVTRDRMMDTYSQEYPVYGFIRHKGYGTKEHMDALRKYGACPLHRQSFRPVQLSSPDIVNKRFARDLQPRRGGKRAVGSISVVSKSEESK